MRTARIAGVSGVALLALSVMLAVVWASPAAHSRGGPVALNAPGGTPIKLVSATTTNLPDCDLATARATTLARVKGSDVAFMCAAANPDWAQGSGDRVSNRAARSAA